MTLLRRVDIDPPVDEGDVLGRYLDWDSPGGREDILCIWAEEGNLAPFPEDLLRYLRRHHPISLFGRLAKWWRER